MFTKSLTVLLVLLSGNAAAATSLRTVEDVATVSLFRGWAELHDKAYATEEEAMKRLEIWMENHGMCRVENRSVEEDADATYRWVAA